MKIYSGLLLARPDLVRGHWGRRKERAEGASYFPLAHRAGGGEEAPPLTIERTPSELTEAAHHTHGVSRRVTTQGSHRRPKGRAMLTAGEVIRGGKGKRS